VLDYYCDFLYLANTHGQKFITRQTGVAAVEYGNAEGEMQEFIRLRAIL